MSHYAVMHDGGRPVLRPNAAGADADLELRAWWFCALFRSKADYVHLIGHGWMSIT